MKFTVETFEQEKIRRRNWRPFFAIWPRGLTNTNPAEYLFPENIGEYRFLEWIERRSFFVGGLRFGYWQHEYRPISRVV